MFDLIFYPFYSLSFAIIVYAYIAFCLMTVARKTNKEEIWFAWIPILNLYLISKIAQKPWWWTILLLIPIVNIFAGVIAYIEIAKTLKKPWWTGIIMVIPLINLVGWGYFAFYEDDNFVMPKL